MKAHITNLGIAVTVILCISSCTKLDPLDPSINSMLIKNTWKLVEITPTGTSSNASLIGAEWKFNQDGTLGITFLVPPNSSGIIHAAWSTTKDKKITIKVPTLQPDGSTALNDFLLADISSLNTKYLELRESAGSLNAGMYVYYYKFNAK